MARINIEEHWWIDPRRDALRKLLGSESQDQVAIRAWRLAQEFWARGHLIPYEIFKYTEGAQALIDCGLARIKDRNCIDPVYIQAESKQDPSRLQGSPNVLQQSFVYVGGSRDYLTWVRDQRDKGKEGGKKSAQRPRDAMGRLLKKSKQNPSKIQADSKGLQASYSDSYSFSDSYSDSFLFAETSKKSEEENKNSTEGGVSESSEDLKSEDESPGGEGTVSPTPVTLVWRSYKKAYEKKHGPGSATWNERTGGQLAQFIRRVPEAEAPDIAAFYVSHPDAFYVRSGHPVGLLLQNAEKLRMEWMTGKRITGTQARQMEKDDAAVDGVKAYLREKNSGGAS